MRTKSIIRLLPVFGLLIVIAACRPASETGYSGAIPEGLRATIKSDGHIFKLEVARVEGLTSTLVARWGDKVVGKQRLYRGFYPLDVQREGVEYSFKFDPDQVESLFPLTVGKESSFKETYIPGKDLEGEEDSSYWVTMEVTSEDTLHIKGTPYDVFVIDITSNYKADGRLIHYKKRVWYSERLGLALKTYTKNGGKKSYSRVMSVTLPEDREEPKRRPRTNELGTIMI